MEGLGRLSTDNIVFPHLGIDITIGKEAFQLFGLSIKWYGFIIAVGMLLAFTYCFRRTKEFGLEENRLIDVVIAGFLAAIAGARLYYVALHPDSFHEFTDILAINKGGLAIYGGIIGAVVVGVIAAKIRKVRVLPVLDIASMGFFIGQCVGRWGNFFNQEAFGTNTTLPWGMSGGTIQRYISAHQADFAAQGIVMDPTVPVHPCFLYESLWCLAGFLILHFYHKHRKFDGELFCIYALWYGTGRFFIEGLRTDSLYIGNIRASQLLAAVSAIAALAVLIIVRIKAKKKAFVLYRDTEESKNILLKAEKAEKEAEEKRRNKKVKELTADQKIIDDDESDEAESSEENNDKSE